MSIAQTFGQNVVTNRVGGYVGHASISYCLAKIASKKYNLPFYYIPFNYSDIFKLDEIESKNLPKGLTEVAVKNENQIISHLPQSRKNFSISIYTLIKEVDFDWKKLLQPLFQLKEQERIEKIVDPLPQDYITVALHIRKGTGGAQQFDGVQKSQQYYQHDLAKVDYISDRGSYPFDFDYCFRPSSKKIDQVDKGSWVVKFPPEQYYVDQLILLANSTNKPLFVQIFTDDKCPLEVVSRVKNTIKNYSNVVIYYHDHKKYSFKEQAAIDLYSMSRFDVLIRSQSYFTRLVEIMGNHKLTIYPLEGHWENGKLIMHKIYVNGSMEDLFKGD